MHSTAAANRGTRLRYKLARCRYGAGEELRRSAHGLSRADPGLDLSYCVIVFTKSPNLKAEPTLPRQTIK